MSFKIFIYKIPDNLLYLQYKRDLIKENSEFINSYKLEFYFDKIINNDKYIITKNINEAALYYIPQFYAPLWQGTSYKVNGEYLDNIIQFIQDNYKNFIGNEHRHILVCSADAGLFALPHGKYTDTHLVKCIHLKHIYEENSMIKQICVPPAPFYHPSVISDNEKNKIIHCNSIEHKNILAYFSGHINNDNINYSKGVRQFLYKNKNNYNNIIIKQGFDPNYKNMVERTKYLLCPEGWVAFTYRDGEAVRALCIPVIISLSKKPFYKYLNYEDNIIRISPDDIESLSNLEKILEDDLKSDYNRKIQFWKEHREALIWDLNKGLSEQKCGKLILKELSNFLPNDM